MANDPDVIAWFTGANPKYTVSINPTTNQPMVVGFHVDPVTKKTTNKLVPFYLYVGSDGNFDIRESIDDVVKRYTADFEKAGTTQAVWNAMLASGDVTKKEYETKDPAGWYKGLAKFVSSFGVGQVDAANRGTAKSFTPFSTWFKKAGGSSSSTSSSGTRKGTTTTTSGYVSSQAEADNEINAFFMEQLDRNATLDERKEYLELLNAEENKLKSTRTSTTTSTSTSGASVSSEKTGEKVTTTGPGGVTQADRNRIMSGVLAKTLKNTPTADLMKGTGAIARTISDLQAYAGDYGLANYTADLAKKDLTDKLLAGTPISPSNLDAERLAIRSMAKTFYPGLASLIDQGVKVSSIGNIYAQEMQKILEIPYTSIDWANDKYISKALQNKGMDGTSQGKEGALNLNDFAIMLRNDARWSKTQNAREEAATYANSILRSFGLAG